MLLLGSTDNGIECTGPGAHRAADTFFPLDHRLKPLVEVRLHGLSRASFRTHHALTAFGVINLGKTIHHGDGLKFTCPHAFAASDAARLAVGRNSLAHSRIVTGDVHFLFCRPQFHDALRTYGNALSTALAFFLIDYGNMSALINMNGSKRTFAGTGSKSHTGKFAGLVAV